MSMRMRELNVMMEDEFNGQLYSFKMQIFPFPIVKSSYFTVFSLGRDDVYEQFGAKKSDIESFKKLNNLTDVKYPILSLEGFGQTANPAQTSEASIDWFDPSTARRPDRRYEAGHS